MGYVEVEPIVDTRLERSVCTKSILSHTKCYEATLVYVPHWTLFHFPLSVSVYRQDTYGE